MLQTDIFYLLAIILIIIRIIIIKIIVYGQLSVLPIVLSCQYACLN